MTKARLQDKVVRPDYWAFVGICHTLIWPCKNPVEKDGGYEAHGENYLHTNA